MKYILFTFCLALFSLGNAQAQTEPSFEEMQKQMQAMQQQMLQMFGLDSTNMGMASPFGGGMDTTFFFQSDSSFLGENGFGSMFRMHPFGLDSEGGMNLEDMMRSFGDIMQVLENFDGSDGFSTYPPADDGDRLGDEDLLPEERLPQEESGETPPPKAKKKRKTVKI